MRLAIVVVIALALSGCASSIMKGFVGQPIQQVMVRYGSPANAFDMADGTRAFQWVLTSTYVAPVNVANSGTVRPTGYGSAAWTQNTQITGGYPITGQCAYTMFGRWDATANTWIMTGYAKPNLACQ